MYFGRRTELFSPPMFNAEQRPTLDYIICGIRYTD